MKNTKEDGEKKLFIKKIVKVNDKVCVETINQPVRVYAPAQKKKNANFMKFKTVLKLEIFISSSSKVLGLVVVRHCCKYNPEPEIVLKN